MNGKATMLTGIDVADNDHVNVHLFFTIVVAIKISEFSMNQQVFESERMSRNGEMDATYPILTDFLELSFCGVKECGFEENERFADSSAVCEEVSNQVSDGMVKGRVWVILTCKDEEEKMWEGVEVYVWRDDSLTGAQKLSLPHYLCATPNEISTALRHEWTNYYVVRYDSSAI